MASENSINQKKEEVAKLAETMKEAKLILLTDYRGINVADVTNLRTDLRKVLTIEDIDHNCECFTKQMSRFIDFSKVNAEYRVIKNNITKRALAECKIEGLDDKLEGPTAVITTNEDYLDATKIIYKFSKDNDYYKIKGGVVDGKVMTTEEIITLAKLPSRQDLLSMLAGGLLANISKFAVALEQVRLQKEQAAE